MASRNAKIENAKEDTKAAVEQTAADLQEGARKVADSAREAGREYAERARDEAGRLYEEGRRRADAAAAHAEEYYDELSDLVRRKPAQALGIAAGVGFLVGILLARR